MIRLVLFVLGASVAFGQSLDSVFIPRKTEIFITLGRSINTKTATAGDKFYGVVDVPVTVDDEIVIPIGSHIIGHIGASQKPGYLRGKAQLALRFDTIILPDGTTRQIEAVAQSVEGYETGTSEDGTIQASGGQGAETLGSATGGAVTGGVIGAIAGRDWKGVGVGSAVGAAGGAILGVFKKGEEVALPKGTSVTVQFYDRVRFVKPAPPNPGKRLEP